MEIFLKDATPNFIFTTIKDMFLGEEEEVFLYADLDEIKYCDDCRCYYDNDEMYSAKIEMIPDVIDNKYLLPKFVINHYDYDLVPNEDGSYFGVDAVKFGCTINITEYAKLHSELYMFQLKILSAFIEKLGTAQETDTIIETILDATKILADNHANECISKLLTDEIYKNLWFDDNIKTKVSNLIQ